MEPAAVSGFWVTGRFASNQSAKWQNGLEGEIVASRKPSRDAGLEGFSLGFGAHKSAAEAIRNRYAATAEQRKLIAVDNWRGRQTLTSALF